MIYFSNCQSSESEDIFQAHLIFPNTIDTLIYQESSLTKEIFYYFEGNCSVCYMKMKDLIQDFPDCKIIAITSSIDTSLIVYQFEILDLDASLLFDRDSTFYSLNQKVIDKERIIQLLKPV